MANDHFQITLTRKLRMPLWPTHDSITCACGQQMDAFGDHTFCCKKIVKNSMSNEIRYGFIRILKHLLVTAKSILGAASIEKELPNLLHQLAPKLRPCDLSIKLDHITGKDRWHTSLDRIDINLF